MKEILHVRHHSLFTPRDFDVSPYFEIVKPGLASGFDYRRLQWGERAGWQFELKPVLPGLAATQRSSSVGIVAARSRSAVLLPKISARSGE